MSKKSGSGKVIRKSASEIPPATKADLDRLRAAMQGPIDTSEISERRQFQRLYRDASGRLPPRKSLIREAIAQQMEAQRLTAYRLWRLAKVHYSPLSQSAVHEFLRGQRQLELPSIEALLAALDLRLVGATNPRRHSGLTPKRGTRKVS